MQEYQGGGTDPKSAAAFPLVTIDQITRSLNSSTLQWRSVPGKRYQLQSRANFSGAAWQNSGTSVTASGLSVQAVDLSATAAFRFYRVQVLP